MIKKVLAIVLVTVVLGVSGYSIYASSMYNAQNKDMAEELISQYNQQRKQLDIFSNSLASFENEYRDTIVSLEEMLDDTARILQKTQVQLDSYAETIDALESRIASAESATTIDTVGIYASAVTSTVRITDGTVLYGSGFIYDAEGHVITAYHVIEEIDTIYVVLHDGRVSRADVTGFSSESDVAVVKMRDVADIVPVAFGDSSQVVIGEPAIAIGTPSDGEDPFGIPDTLTSGIISQLNRYVDIDGNSVANLIQFDVPINYGNSGCALFNARQEVIGLVIARIPPTIGDGISWAVSSNKVKLIADTVIATGSFPYPRIGVGIRNLAPQDVLDMSLDTANGVLASSVYPGTPAEQAGFQVNDVITGMDGRIIRSVDELVSLLGEYYRPGDTTIVNILRNGVPLKLTVIVGTID